MTINLERDVDLQEQYDAQRFTPEHEEWGFNCLSNFINVPNFENKASTIRQFQEEKIKEYDNFIGNYYYGGS